MLCEFLVVFDEEEAEGVRQIQNMFCETNRRELRREDYGIRDCDRNSQKSVPQYIYSIVTLWRALLRIFAYVTHEPERERERERGRQRGREGERGGSKVNLAVHAAYRA